MRFRIASLAILVLALAACAPPSASNQAPAATAAPTVAAATVAPTAAAATAAPTAAATTAPTIAAAMAVTTTNKAAMVMVAKNDKMGQFLADADGRTLYLFTKDTKNTSNCSGNCLTAWPPLLSTGAPVSGAGVTASLLGTIKTSDGKDQVTYNGWPLYYYAKDVKPGDTVGQGVGGSWYVVSPQGDKVG